jgi:hypothetical protein
MSCRGATCSHGDSPTYHTNPLLDFSGGHCCYDSHLLKELVTGELNIVSEQCVCVCVCVCVDGVPVPLRLHLVQAAAW